MNDQVKTAQQNEAHISPSLLNDGLGRDALWAWFGLSYSTWLTLPRVMMHEMPDEWQGCMAELLSEWDAEWDSSGMPSPYVSARKGNKFVRWPSWLLNYKRPDKEQLNMMRPNMKLTLLDEASPVERSGTKVERKVRTGGYMYHNEPPPRCKNCGSIRSERFHQVTRQGIRCLDCGHEHATMTRNPNGTSTTWTRSETDNVF